MDRQAVVVETQGETLEVDHRPPDAVAPLREPVRPGGEERQAGRAPGAQGVEPARKRQVLRPSVTQRDAGHAHAWREHDRERARGQLDRGLTSEPALPATAPSTVGYFSHSIWVASGRLMYADARVDAT